MDDKMIERMSIAHHNVRMAQGYATKPWGELEDRVRHEYRVAMRAAVEAK